MNSKPTVALCMIVKNEESHLPGCLESVLGLVDQVVVVDTGSTDRTVEIAAKAGAAVHFFPWIDDFAAARNESLRHATCDWVLWMDADERLNGLGAQDCLRRVISSGTADAFLTPIRSFKPDPEGGFDFHYAIRLFRNFPGIQFVGKVHEYVDPFLLKIGARIVRAPFLLEHLGYTVDASGMEQKLRRNLSLLERSLADQKANAHLHYHLGLTYIGLKEEEKSWGALQQALASDGLTPNIRAMSLNLIAFHQLSRKEYRQAAQTAEEALSIVPRQNTAHLLLGIARYNLNEHRQALPHLLQAYQFLRQPPEQRKTEISQEHSYDEGQILRAIGMCHAHLSQFPEAIAFLSRFLRAKVQDPEVHRIVGTCYLNSQNPLLAARHLEQAETEGMDPATLALAMAFAQLQLCREPEACEYLLKAPSASFDGTEGQAMIEAFVNHFLQQGRVTACCELLAQLARRHPHQPRILDALVFSYIKAGDFAQALAVCQLLHRLDPLNDKVKRTLAALLARQHELATPGRKPTSEQERLRP